MLIPWNIANQQENKCSLHAASKKDNSPPLRAVQCTVQSKLLFNFRVTMFNSLWPLCKIELVDSAFAQIIVIESRREFLRRPNLFSSAIIDYIVPNLARHVRNILVDLNEMCFFCFVFVWNANIAISSSVSVWNQRQRLNDKKLQKAQWTQLLGSITLNWKL